MSLKYQIFDRCWAWKQFFWQILTIFDNFWSLKPNFRRILTLENQNVDKFRQILTFETEFRTNLELRTNYDPKISNFDRFWAWNQFFDKFWPFLTIFDHWKPNFDEFWPWTTKSWQILTFETEFWNNFELITNFSLKSPKFPKA